MYGSDPSCSERLLAATDAASGALNAQTHALGELDALGALMADMLAEQAHVEVPSPFPPPLALH
jgi:hypothetical protein